MPRLSCSSFVLRGRLDIVPAVNQHLRFGGRYDLLQVFDGEGSVRKILAPQSIKWLGLRVSDWSMVWDQLQLVPVFFLLLVHRVAWLWVQRLRP